MSTAPSGSRSTVSTEPTLPPASPRSWGRRLLLGVLVVGAVVAAGVFGWRWWTEGRFLETTDNAYIQGDITSIAPKISGYVDEVAVSDNEVVSAGQLLVRLDSADYRVHVDQARASAEGKAAELASIIANIELQQTTIAQARGAMDAAQARFDRAAKDLARYQDLVGRGATSRQSLDSAREQATSGAAELRSAVAALDGAQKRLAVLSADRDAAAAEVRSAQAQRALAEINLANTEIRAPIAGVVGNRGVRAGQYVAPGSALMAIVPLDGLWIAANFKETQLGAMAPGQTVKVEIDAYSGRHGRGRVVSFAPASGAQFSLLPPENATGNFTKVVQRVPVRIEMLADDPLSALMRPGLSVEVSVDTRGGRDVALGLVGTALAGSAGSSPTHR
ncbi:secretion protein HlyD [Rhodospirillum rubrum]|uniref:HlyD family secretion protein n=1 Tax=Rhodospirillum rubrum TaxID=1085 RepID=UPI001908D0D0|nr:HlyD family secretion protein [Rhodospirillum rubrum]MBK1665492.1 secretion protein HlyD [Rhodospirillum rubrum]MBK1678102.1 secretion protein HlyD [Rhodospirillum rubrum]